jgi:hypothetical protein
VPALAAAEREEEEGEEADADGRSRVRAAIYMIWEETAAPSISKSNGLPLFR